VADFRPFVALRYDPVVAGDASALIAPPFDVVSPAERQALYATSPFNVSHIDYGEQLPTDTAADSVYTRSRARIEEWSRKGVLGRDGTPRLYVYDQVFALPGEMRRRRAVFGRLRLEEWEKGVILPHEHTGAGPKADRLSLLQNTRVNLSPIMALHRNDRGSPLVPEEALGAPVLDAVMAGGERHTLRPVEPAAAARACEALSTTKLYIADGHHRYETALNYRNERREATPVWTGEEPENFVLAAIVDVSDPGLAILPTHRIIRPRRQPDDAVRRLDPYFEVEDMGALGDDVAVTRLLARLADAASGGAAFGGGGLVEGRLHLLRAKDPATLDALLPADHAPVWRRLDVNVLHHVALPAIGYEMTPDSIEFTEDYRRAVEAVRSGRWPLAFLMNATPIDQVLAVADAGELMPQKSTFFYPKLATGMVMYPLD